MGLSLDLGLGLGALPPALAGAAGHGLPHQHHQHPHQQGLRAELLLGGYGHGHGGGGGLSRTSEDGSGGADSALGPDPGSAGGGRLPGGFASASQLPPPSIGQLPLLLPSPLPPSGGGGLLGLQGGGMGRGGGAGSSGSLKRKSDTGRYNLSKVERRVVVMDRWVRLCVWGGRGLSGCNRGGVGPALASFTSAAHTRHGVPVAPCVHDPVAPRASCPASCPLHC